MKGNYAVVDASIILKWVLPYETEELMAEAYELRDRYGNGQLEIRLPTLWAYEIGNTVNRLDSRHAGDLLDDLISCGFRERSIDRHLAALASKLCQKYKVTFYDACYHAVALEDGGVFVTADNQYISKARQAGGIVSLRDFADSI